MSEERDPCEAICDALVELLNGLSDTKYQFNAEKPDDIMESLDRAHERMQVYLIPFGEDESKIGRGGEAAETYTVSMTICRKINGDKRENLSLFVRQLRRAIRRAGPMAGFTFSTTETITKFDPEALHSLDEFISVVHVNYRGIDCPDDL